MGCYNETCALTGLAIRYMDEVMVFGVEHYGIAGVRSSYIGPYGTAVSFPVVAKYNDYGGVEDFEVNRFSKEFAKFVFEMSNKKDVDTDSKMENIEDMKSAYEIASCALTYPGCGFSEKNTLELVFVLKEAYDKVVSDKFLEEIKLVKEVLSRHKNKDSLLGDSNRLNNLKDVLNTREYENLTRSLHRNNDFLSIPRIGKASILMKDFNVTNSSLECFIIEQITDMSDTELLEIAKYYSFMELFLQLRKTWNTTGSGSQDVNYKEWIKLSSIIKELAYDRLEEI